MKKIGDVTVNDGNGLFDNEGLCDTLIRDLNSLPKMLISGQYIQACAMIVSMAQRLVNLKDGIKKDMQSLKDRIEELKHMNNDLIEQVTGLPADRSNERDGGCDGNEN